MRVKHWNVRLICLLWEQEDPSFVIQFFRDALQRVIEGNNPDIITHIHIFYYAIGLVKKTTPKKLIPIRGVFKLHYGLSMLLRYYKLLVGDLNFLNLYKNWSCLDILSEKKEIFVNYVKNPSFISFLEKFYWRLNNESPYMPASIAIMERIRSIVDHRNCLDSAAIVLRNIFRRIKTLPNKVLSKILSFLTIRELKKVCNYRTIDTYHSNLRINTESLLLFNV